MSTGTPAKGADIDGLNGGKDPSNCGGEQAPKEHSGKWAEKGPESHTVRFFISTWCGSMKNESRGKTTFKLEGKR